MASRQQEADPQLAKLLQLAQVSEAFNKPQQDDAVLAQQDQQHRMALAVQLLGLAQQGQHESAQSQDAANQLAELAKFHEGTLGHEQAALDQQRQERDAIIAQQGRRSESDTLDNLVAHLAGRNDVSLDSLAGVMAKAGHTGLADTLNEQAKAQRQKAVATHLAGYAATPPNKQGAYLKAIRPTLDDSTWQMLQQHLQQTELPSDSPSPSPTPEPLSNPQRGERQPNNLDLSGLFRLLGKLPTSI